MNLTGLFPYTGSAYQEYESDQLVDLERQFNKQVNDNVKRAKRGKAPNVITCWRHEAWYRDLVQKSPICSVGCMYRATLPTGEHVLHCFPPKYVLSAPELVMNRVENQTTYLPPKGEPEPQVKSDSPVTPKEPEPVATHESGPPEERHIDVYDEIMSMTVEQLITRMAERKKTQERCIDKSDDDESDEDEFVDAWGDEPVPDLSSEVLGTQAMEWMSSNAFLNGGRRRGGKKGRGGGRRRGGGQRQRIPRVLVNRGRSFMSNRFRTHLDYDLPFTAPLATALFPYAIEYVVLTNPNNVTTVSTLLPGYAGLALMYRKYRTFKFIFSFIAVNNDNFGMEIFACPINFVPSLVAAPTAFFSQPECRTKVLSAKGGIDQKTLIWKGTVAGFGGSASTSVEDAYCGTTDNTAPPTDNMYLIYGTRTNGNASVSAPLFKIRLRVFLEFYELQSPTS
jgi:hypothetical protein